MVSRRESQTAEEESEPEEDQLLDSQVSFASFPADNYSDDEWETDMIFGAYSLQEWD